MMGQRKFNMKQHHQLCLDDLVSPGHLYRKIDRIIDFAFIYDFLSCFFNFSSYFMIVDFLIIFIVFNLINSLIVLCFLFRFFNLKTI